MKRARTRRLDRSRDLVGFLLAGVHYAIDVRHVREIVHPAETAPMPHGAPFVLGVASHRGEPVPVIDLKARLGIIGSGESAASATRPKWIIVETGSQKAALVVDSMTSVFGITEPDDDDPRARGVSALDQGVRIAYAPDDALVFVIDVDRFARPI